MSRSRLGLLRNSKFEFGVFAQDVFRVADHRGPLGTTPWETLDSWDGRRARGRMCKTSEMYVDEVTVGKLETSFQSCSASLAAAGLTALFM